MLRGLVHLLLLSLSVSAYGQYVERANFQYKSKSYDIISFNVDSGFISSISILENNSLSAENIYFDSLMQSRKFFAITAGSVDTLCNLLGFVVSNGVVRQKLNLGVGIGNFYAFGNSVLVMSKESIYFFAPSSLIRSTQYDFAIQSGPILVEKGKINSFFSNSSQNKYIRCGVGVSGNSFNQKLHFVLSNEPVTFYQISDLFLSKLKCSDALLLESSFLASAHFPNIQRSYSPYRKVCKYIYIKL